MDPRRARRSGCAQGQVARGCRVGGYWPQIAARARRHTCRVFRVPCQAVCRRRRTPWHPQHTRRSAIDHRSTATRVPPPRCLCSCRTRRAPPQRPISCGTRCVPLAKATASATWSAPTKRPSRQADARSRPRTVSATPACGRLTASCSLASDSSSSAVRSLTRSWSIR